VNTQLHTNFKKPYDYVGMKLSCNVLTEFDIPVKLVRLTETRLNKILNGQTFV
jgi:hypothetical protein